MTKSLHDQTKQIYGIPFGLTIFMYLSTAMFLIFGSIPLFPGYISRDGLLSDLGMIFCFGLFAMLNYCTAAFSWLAISEHGLEVHLLFHHVYTPWENVEDLLVSPFHVYSVALHDPTPYTIWPLPFGGRTQRIIVSWYGNKKDAVDKQIAYYIYTYPLLRGKASSPKI